MDLFETYEVSRQAVEYARKTRRPTFLHLKFVRLLGHAGSDVEQLYRSIDEIEMLESKDPLLHNAKRIVQLGIATSDEILNAMNQFCKNILRLGKIAITKPKITSAQEVFNHLLPSIMN